MTLYCRRGWRLGKLGARVTKIKKVSRFNHSFTVGKHRQPSTAEVVQRLSIIAKQEAKPTLRRRLRWQEQQQQEQEEQDRRVGSGGQRGIIRPDEEDPPPAALGLQLTPHSPRLQTRTSDRRGRNEFALSFSKPTGAAMKDQTTALTYHYTKSYLIHYYTKCSGNSPKTNTSGHQHLPPCAAVADDGLMGRVILRVPIRAHL